MESCSLSPPSSPCRLDTDENLAEGSELPAKRMKLDVSVEKPKSVCLLWPDSVQRRQLTDISPYINPICNCDSVRFSEEYSQNLLYPSIPNVSSSRPLFDTAIELHQVIEVSATLIEDMYDHPLQDHRHHKFVEQRAKINDQLQKIKIELLSYLSHEGVGSHMKIIGPLLQALILNVGQISEPKCDGMNLVCYRELCHVRLEIHWFILEIFYDVHQLVPRVLPNLGFHKLFDVPTSNTDSTSFHLYFRYILNEILIVLARYRRDIGDSTELSLEAPSFSCDCFESQFALMVRLGRIENISVVKETLLAMQEGLLGGTPCVKSPNFSLLNQWKNVVDLSSEAKMKILFTILQVKIDGKLYADVLADLGKDCEAYKVNQFIHAIVTKESYSMSILVELMKLQKIRPLAMELIRKLMEHLIELGKQPRLVNAYCPSSLPEWERGLRRIADIKTGNHMKVHEILIRIIKDFIFISKKSIRGSPLQFNGIVTNSQLAHYVLSLLLLIAKENEELIDDLCRSIELMQSKCAVTARADKIQTRKLFILAVSMLSSKKPSALGIMSKILTQIVQTKNDDFDEILPLFTCYVEECIDLIDRLPKPYSEEIMGLVCLEWKCIYGGELSKTHSDHFLQIAVPLLKRITEILLDRVSISNVDDCVNKLILSGLYERPILEAISRMHGLGGADQLLANLLVVHWRGNRVPALQLFKTCVSFRTGAETVNNLYLLAKLSVMNDGHKLLCTLDSGLAKLWFSCLLITHHHDQNRPKLDQLCYVVKNCPSLKEISEGSFGVGSTSAQLLDEILERLKRGDKTRCRKLANEIFGDSLEVLLAAAGKLGGSSMQKLDAADYEVLRCCEYAVTVIGNILVKCADLLYEKGNTKSFIYKVHNGLMYARKEVTPPVETYLSKRLRAEYVRGMFGIEGWQTDLALVRMTVKEVLKPALTETLVDDDALATFLAIIDPTFPGYCQVRLALWKNLLADSDLKCDGGDSGKIEAFNTFFKKACVDNEILCDVTCEESHVLAVLFLRMLIRAHAMPVHDSRLITYNLARTIRQTANVRVFEDIPRLLVEKEEKLLFGMVSALDSAMTSMPRIIPQSFIRIAITSARNSANRISNATDRERVERKCDEIFARLNRV